MFRLAVFGITLLASMPARATPPCPGPLEVISKPDVPSPIWKPAPSLPGAVTSVAAASKVLYASTIVDGKAMLYELAGDRWTRVERAPGATAVLVRGDVVYAFVRTADRTEVVFARRPIKTWTPTTAIPIAASSVFACGESAICASPRAIAHGNVTTYAGNPEPSGEITDWKHVLTTGAFTGIATPGTTFGSKSYLVTREGTYANAIGLDGTHGSTWDRCGPPPPIAQPVLVGHGGWLFALGGTSVDLITTIGKCPNQPRNIASHLTSAASINPITGLFARWSAAAPLPSGGAAHFASDGERLYRLASPTSSTTEVTFAVWSELIDSIERSATADFPPEPPTVPASHEWRMKIANGWFDRPAFPIAGGTYAIEWRRGHPSDDPQTVLRVEWIRSRYTGAPDDGLALSNGKAFEALVHGFVSQAAREDGKPGISKSLDVKLARPPHARRLRIIGQIQSSESLAIVAGTCSGEARELAACEAILETLRLPEFPLDLLSKPQPDPETTSVLRWLLGMLGLAVVVGVVYWVSRRVRAS